MYIKCKYSVYAWVAEILCNVLYNVFLCTPKIQSGILGFNFPLVLSPERKLLKVQAPKKTYMFRSSLSNLYHDTMVQYHIHKLDENLLRRY